MLVKPILAKEGPERNGATALSERQETQPAAAPAPPTPRFQYAVKFICGRGDGKVVAQGSYFTAINVHNPTGDAVGFSKKFAVALPEEKAGPVTKFFEARLSADEALEIDNEDIFRHTQSRPGFLKGFVVIETKVELDVVAVYTAAGANGQVETLHTERVPPRRQSTAGSGPPTRP